jgi:hypothetical protein
MRLRLQELQRVVDRTLAEEKAVDALRQEVSRVLGPSVLTNVKLDQLAEGANDRISVLERTGRESQINFKPAVMLKFADSASVEARVLAARTLPERYVARMRGDKSAAVRHAVARRLPASLVKEMLKRTPNDDALRVIFHDKKLTEAGLATPDKKDEPFDMYGEEPLGDTVKQDGAATDEGLSDAWYETTAHKFIQDYGGNIEGQWEEPVVHRFCASSKATSGVEIDEKKLYKEIMKQLKEKDDRTLERYALKEIAQSLREGLEPELPQLFSEAVDPLETLLHSDVSAAEYVKQANKLFNVRESVMPKSLRKFRVTEGLSGDIKIPCLARVPGNGNVSRLAERALDLYVKNWNMLQAMNGEPVRINWSTNPTKAGMISFNAELR